MYLGQVMTICSIVSLALHMSHIGTGLYLRIYSVYNV